jgi:hypothetical protein
MTERFPADSLHNVPPLDMGNIRVESKRISKSESKKINAYRLTENGISPKAIPSWITDVIYADRDEYTEAIRYKGFSPVDVLQPCVSVNKKNTYAWYSGRVYKVNDAGGYDEANIEHAFQKASEWGIPSDRSYLQERETDIRGVERTGEQGTAC